MVFRWRRNNKDGTCEMPWFADFIVCFLKGIFCPIVSSYVISMFFFVPLMLLPAFEHVSSDKVLRIFDMPILSMALFMFFLYVCHSGAQKRYVDTFAHWRSRTFSSNSISAKSLVFVLKLLSSQFFLRGFHRTAASEHGQWLLVSQLGGIAEGGISKSKGGSLILLIFSYSSLLGKWLVIPLEEPFKPFISIYN